MNERKGFLLSLMLVLGAIAFLMIRPFLGYLFGAVILAFVLYPFHKKLSKVLGGRLSAFTLVVLGIFLVILPVMFAAMAVIEDASDLAGDVNTTSVVNTTQIEKQITEFTGRNVDLEKSLNQALDNFTSYTFGSFTQFLGLLADLSIGMTVMLFLLYYMLKDGVSAVDWMKAVTPLPEEIQEKLYERVNTTTWAVIKGHVLIAIIQGLVGGIGLALTGIPNYAFWTFVMVLLGFIPIIGTTIVWLPASVYLYLIDRPLAALILAIYGFVIVGMTDNILRPIIVDRTAKIHPAVILMGVIGGVYLFGAAGLFIGPIMLGVFKSVILAFKNNYKDL